MLHLIFWAFILVLGLSYFGISVEAILHSPTGQENIAYISHLLSQGWLWLEPYVQPIIATLQNSKS
jgi:hypothetical protein